MKAIKTPAAVTLSLDEIIFAQKNKAYGAYLLRKHYARHISIALFLSLLIVTIFSISSIVMNRAKKADISVVPSTKEIVISFVQQENENITNVAKPVEQTQVLSKATLKFMAPVITPDGADNEELIPTADELSKALPWIATQQGSEDGVDPNIIIEVPPAVTKIEKSIENHEESAVTFAEVMPSYVGGEAELFSFINQNVHYPDIAMKAGVEGKVLVEFVIEKDGSLSHIEVVKSVGGGCDEEALRVCRLMKAWNPGLQNGRPVRVKVVIPFQFRLN